MGRAKSSPAGYSGIEALSHVLRTQAREVRRAARQSAPADTGPFKDWTIGVDADGNLVAKHRPSGVVRILAQVPEESEGTNG